MGIGHLAQVKLAGRQVNDSQSDFITSESTSVHQTCSSNFFGPPIENTRQLIDANQDKKKERKKKQTLGHNFLG